MLLNWNSLTVNMRENRAGKYLKLLKYSTASLYREPALGLPFGQISGMIYAAQDPEVPTLRLGWFMACY